MKKKLFICLCMALWIATAHSRAALGKEASVATRYLGQLSVGELRDLLKEPSGVALYGGKVFVSDTKGHRLVVFSPEGRVLKIVGKKGKAPLEFSSPRAMVTDEKGNLYVVDQGNKRVQVLTESGAFVRAFGQEMLSSPVGIALGLNERLYVTDPGTGRIAVFSRDGVFLGNLGISGKEPGLLRTPSGVSTLPDGRIVVAEEGNGNLLLLETNVFAAERGLVFHAGRYSSVIADEWGRIFALDRDTARVTIFDLSGKELHAFGSAGTGRGQFQEPMAMAMTPPSNTATSRFLWIANTGNNRIDQFEVTIERGDSSLLPQARDEMRLQRGVILSSHVAAQQRLEELLYFLDTHTGQILTQSYSFHEKISNTNPVRTFTLGYKTRPEKPALLQNAMDFAVVASERDQKVYYVADKRDQKIHVLTGNGDEKFAFGGSGSGQGQLREPRDLHLLRNELFVLDAGNDRVQVFSLDGVFLREIRSQNGFLREPAAMAIHQNGEIFVADVAMRHVIVLNTNGSEVRKWPFAEPLSIALDQNNWLYVLDKVGSQVWVRVRNAKGEPVFQFHVEGSSDPGEPLKFSPSRIAVESGRLIQVRLFDPENGVEALYGLDPVPQKPDGFLVDVAEDKSEIKITGTPFENFVDQIRLYRLRDDSLHLVSEAKPAALSYPRPSGEPPYVFQLSAVSVGGLESTISNPFRDHFHEGVLWFERGEDVKAIKSFDAHRAAYGKNHGPSLKFEALAYARNGQTEGAEKLYDLLANDPRYQSTVDLLKAQTFLQTRSYVEAERLFRDLRVKEPQSDEVWIGLAQSLAGQGQTQRAISVLQDAIKAQPQNANLWAQMGEYYYRSRLYTKSKESYEKALSLEPNSAAVWSAMAAVQVAQGNQAAAVMGFERALALNNSYLPAIVGLGELYLTQKEYAKAETLLETLPDSLKSQGSVKALEGRLLAARGKTEDAIAKMAEIAEGENASAEIVLELGSLYERRGQLDDALTLYQNYLNRDTRNTQVWCRSGQLALRRKDFAKAKWAFEQAISFAPNATPAREGLGDLALAKGDFDQAMEQYRKAMTYAEPPQAAGLYVKIGRASLQADKAGEAIAAFEEAIRKDPAFHEAYFELAKVARANSFLTKAQEAMLQAVALNPKEAEYHFEMAQIHAQNFRLDEALKSLKEAQRLQPQEERYRVALNDMTQKKRKTLESNLQAPAVEILSTRFDKVFAAIYKSYAKKPLGEIKIRNNTEASFSKVTVSFHVKEYMDFPATYSYPQLAAHEILSVPVRTEWSGRILDLNEDITVQGQIRVTYVSNGVEKKHEVTEAIKIFNRNALIWSDDAMIAAFITPKDGPVANFAREAEKQFAAETKFLDGKMAQAVRIFDALGALGLSYVSDPNTPYAKMSDSTLVDSIQFPRDTLVRRSGDCDDLVVLLSSALENVGIETMLVEVPGHLFLVLSTGLSSAGAKRLSENENLLVMSQGKIWLPVETTLVGKPFAFAWRKGAEIYRKAEAEKSVKLVSVHRAWERYEPATLPVAKAASMALPLQRMASLITEDVAVLTQQSRTTQERDLQLASAQQGAPGDLEARLQRGLALAKRGDFGSAKEVFRQVLKGDERNIAARVNLGNVYLKEGDPDGAIQEYLKAEEYDNMDAEIKINLAIAYYQKQRIDLAKRKCEEARKINPDLVEENAYLKSVLLD